MKLQAIKLLTDENISPKVVEFLRQSEFAGFSIDLRRLSRVNSGY